MSEQKYLVILNTLAERIEALDREKRWLEIENKDLKENLQKANERIEMLKVAPLEARI